ncbi:MAG: type I methionyl aminopeptidase [Thiothrix sp.]|nr:type I methionyl aminopeptidase [Thiothrix sp.]
MAIHIKSAEEIEKMRVAGQLAAEVLGMIEPHVKPGVSTNELNQLCHDYIVNVQQAIPAPLGYGNPPYPKSICTSINHQICHGIPSDKRLKKGDSLNIDVTIIKDGFHGDTSKMFHAGQPTVAGQRLSDITQQCMYLGIRAVRPGATLGDIGQAIQQHAEKNYCSVVREFCGHGIGLRFHEEPQVLHYGKAGEGLVLEPGMIFTIEPMINQGKPDLKILPDQWTAVTKDHKLSAQWEHMVLVTPAGYEVLTLRPEEAGWESRLQ